MKMCASHWKALRVEIANRGLAALVSETGEQAAANLVSEMQQGPTVDTFDPLMGAYLAIWNNAMSMAEKSYGANPLAMLTDDPEHPEWQCPICFLNWLHADHDARCTQPDCNYPKDYKYDWMIDRAVDEMVEEWKKFSA